MTTYSIGELAHEFDISTRTLQYYDETGILSPASVNENRYRIYTDAEVEKLKLIQIMKALGMQLKEIKILFETEGTLDTVRLMLDQKNKQLQENIEKQQAQQKQIRAMQNMIHETSQSSVTQLKKMDRMLMKNEKLKPLRMKMIALGSVGTLSLWSGIGMGIKTHHLLYPALGVSASIGIASYLTHTYYHQVQYMCPTCQHVFIPSMKEMIFAPHTPSTRYLACPSCQTKGHCVEVYQPH
ncbi:MerR family transcriptional regulator [Staphylococcus muscae]|uniref:MerR family transcriptional regulator n=1 Tax=Staphylococcus muscae TaxID=1294 RepID=A0A240C8U9_9STAP|nr:MerR family transcriptional regulator [Staphylococcus muscae]AVQ33866.1 MerR family transcriptional regulator [Staphylococcus muscae]PNZ04262.1 MerR family transcriptional regulator [Staphylococcus muscae]GGA83684.1 MerR family transcriptional regulator [Staphylococcus muscae]SNW04491.1 MerR family transcriptional regulator [Staphylococcus muscae]